METISNESSGIGTVNVLFSFEVDSSATGTSAVLYQSPNYGSIIVTDVRAHDFSTVPSTTVFSFGTNSPLYDNIVSNVAPSLTTVTNSVQITHSQKTYIPPSTNVYYEINTAELGPCTFNVSVVGFIVQA